SPATAIRLGRLNDADAARLLDRLVRGASLPEALRQNVLLRAAGVPLHIEEMVRGLLDVGVLHAAGSSWSCDASTSEIMLPPTLRAARVARLDRLPSESRDLLGQCAIQGVEFDLRVVGLVRDQESRSAALARMMPELERRGVVTGAGEQRFAFRQPLMQEA